MVKGDATTNKRTATVAKRFDVSNPKLYQIRGRTALPILIRQARLRQPISYTQLADLLGMPNPRNLNFVLGSIGASLLQLTGVWHVEVPPVQSLIVGETTGVPGDGLAWGTTTAEWRKLTLLQQRRKMDLIWQDVFEFRRWSDVLRYFELPDVGFEIDDLIRRASTFGQGGEGEDHLKLKRYIHDHPHVIGATGVDYAAEMERDLPSGDRVDVCFSCANEFIAVEVKPQRAPETDVLRGIFQCVKYQAVLEAMFRLLADQPSNIRTILALGGSLPSRLTSVALALRVQVFENIEHY